MKEENDFSDSEVLKGDERIVDSLLREHARLGAGDDEELVHSILAATVELPHSQSATTTRSSSPMQAPSLGQSWLRVAAVVVVTFTVLSVFLINLKPENQAQAESPGEGRDEVVFQVVVESDEGRAASSGRIDRKILISSRYPSNIRPTISSPSLSGRVSDVELSSVELFSPDSVDFDRSIEQFPERSRIESTFLVAANETTRDGRKVIYSGNVVLRDEHFTLQADSLVLDRSSGGESELFQALNPIIEDLEQRYRIEGETANYDPSRDEVVIKGIRSIDMHGARVTIGEITQAVVAGGVLFFEDRTTGPINR